MMERGGEKKQSKERDPDDSFTYTSHREGVISIFNQFYEEAQRIYGDPLLGLTPRELQEALVKRIPEGAFALEDFVSTFEAASYGRVEPTGDDFDRCEATVELLLGLMGGRSLGELEGEETAGTAVRVGGGGWLVSLFVLLLLGGVAFIILFLFQRELEPSIGELVRFLRSLFG